MGGQRVCAPQNCRCMGTTITSSPSATTVTSSIPWSWPTRRTAIRAWPATLEEECDASQLRPSGASHPYNFLRELRVCASSDLLASPRGGLALWLKPMSHVTQLLPQSPHSHIILAMQCNQFSVHVAAIGRR